MRDRLTQRRHLLLTALLACALAATTTPGACQEQVASAKPETVGMSSEKLALVKPALQQLVDDQKVPGAIVIVSRQGRVVLFESVGWSNIEDKEPMQKDSILRFYSMTKPITSTAIMMLVDQGKLGLDDPVSKHEPKLAGLKVFVEKNGDEVKTERCEARNDDPRLVATHVRTHLWLLRDHLYRSAVWCCRCSIWLLG